MTWPTVPIGGIAHQVRGVSYDKSQVSNSAAPGLRPVLRAGNIQEGTLLLDKDLVYVPGSCIAHQQLLRPGDIVIAASSGSIDVVGKAAQLSEPWDGSFGAFCKVIRLSSDRVNPRYLHHFFQSTGYRRKVSSLAAGANINNLKNEHIDDLILPLPPLEEQRRIAAILDRVQETLSLRRTCLQDLTANLELNLFLDLFGSPATNPKGWELVQIGDLAEIFSDGPFGSNLKSSHYTESGVRVIRLQNIGVREFIDNDKAFISISHYEELSKHACLPGDILIGTLGDPNLRACIQPNHVPIAINKADCVQMRCAESVAHPLFVMHLLNTPDANAMASSLVLGQTRGRISMGRLRGLSIPVPPVELQAEFASRVEKTECLKQSLRTSFAEADRLKGALSHSLFRKS